MRKFIIYLSAIIYLFFCNLVFASETGKFMSLDAIEVTDEVTIPAGYTVKFLGVIDVPVNIAACKPDALISMKTTPTVGV